MNILTIAEKLIHGFGSSTSRSHRQMGARAANQLKNTGCPLLNQANKLPALSDKDLVSLAKMCPHLQAASASASSNDRSNATKSSVIEIAKTHSYSRHFSMLDALTSGATPPGPVARWLEQQKEKDQTQILQNTTPGTISGFKKVIGMDWLASARNISIEGEYNYEKSINSMVHDKYIENKRTVGKSTEQLFNRVGYKNNEKKITGYTSEEYNSIFQQKISDIQSEGRYRIFANLARQAGNFPYADHWREDGSVNQVVAWCSNDYLGMGEHEKVLNAMKSVVDECGAGAGGTRNIAGTNKYHVRRTLFLWLYGRLSLYEITFVCTISFLLF
jgi:hypothetical protein